MFNSKISKLWRMLPLVVFTALVFFLWRGLFLDPHLLPSTQIGKVLPAFNLPRLDDRSQSINEHVFKGRVVLLNMWASWCEACGDEQYFLMKLKKQGVPIIGVNYKDSASRAQQWLIEWGNPYEIVVEDKLGRLAIDLGVYGTPETFLIDKEARVLYRHVGLLNEKVWAKEFLPRIQRPSKL